MLAFAGSTAYVCSACRNSFPVHFELRRCGKCNSIFCFKCAARQLHNELTDVKCDECVLSGRNRASLGPCLKDKALKHFALASDWASQDFQGAETLTKIWMAQLDPDTADEDLYDTSPSIPTLTPTSSFGNLTQDSQLHSSTISSPSPIAFPCPADNADDAMDIESSPSPIYGSMDVFSTPPEHRQVFATPADTRKQTMGAGDNSNLSALPPTAQEPRDNNASAPLSETF